MSSAPVADGPGAVSSRLTVGAYQLASLAARLVPPRAAPALSAIAGATASVAMGERAEMLERHLRRVDPSLQGSALRQAARRALASYARYYLESFRLTALPPATIDAGLTLEGFDHVTAALDSGAGVILALPHLGGWEWAGRWLTAKGYRVTVVVEPLDPPELFAWFTDLRSRLGMTVVALGPEAGSAVAKALANNEIVCLLCDRDIAGGGVEVEFFGERTTLPAGPATLGLRTGAAVLPAAVYFTDQPDGHVAVVRPPVPAERHGKLRADVARMTQALADELAGLIRRAPDQWHLLQPNWPSDPGYGAARQG